MSIKVGESSGGGGNLKLAPDLTYPNRQGVSVTQTVSNVDCTGGLTTVLSLTGKFAISHMYLNGLTSGEAVTLKLTIDGVVIWDTSLVWPGSWMVLLGRTQGQPDIVITCDSSLLLEVQTTSDNSINLIYIARPIL